MGDSAKDIHERLEMEWNGLKKTPLTLMIILNSEDMYLGYVDNKYNVCEHKIGDFNAFLFF